MIFNRHLKTFYVWILRNRCETTVFLVVHFYLLVIFSSVSCQEIVHYCNFVFDDLQDLLHFTKFLSRNRAG